MRCRPDPTLTGVQATEQRIGEDFRLRVLTPRAADGFAGCCVRRVRMCRRAGRGKASCWGRWLGGPFSPLLRFRPAQQRDDRSGECQADHSPEGDSHQEASHRAAGIDSHGSREIQVDEVDHQAEHRQDGLRARRHEQDGVSVLLEEGDARGQEGDGGRENPEGLDISEDTHHDAEVSVVSGVNSVLDRGEGGERPEENKEPQTTADDSKYTCCSRDTGAFRPGRVRGGLGRHAVSVWWGLGLPLLGWDGRLLRLPMGRRTLGVPAPGGVERGGRVAGDAGRSGSRGLAPSGVGGIDRS